MNVTSARILAASDFVRRTGAKSVQIRYSDDDMPIVWIAIAEFDEHFSVSAAFDPERALLRLCEELADGGTCLHCGRPSGFDPDHIETMPLNKVVCWYQWDPELKVFRRSCEGDYP